MSSLGYSSLVESYGSLIQNNSGMIDSSSSLNRDLDINPKVAGMPSQAMFQQVQTPGCNISNNRDLPPMPGIPMPGMGIGMPGMGMGMPGMPGIQEIQYRPEIVSQKSSQYQLHWRNKTDKQKKSDNAYYFQTPYTKFFEIIKEFGTPDAINPMSLGTAIWDSKFMNDNNSIYKCIRIIDEEVYRLKPYPHVGFLYTTIDLHVPYSKVGQVLSISSDITYDIGKKELTARGMSFSYCNALLALVCQYVNGQLSWYNISGNNKPKEYLSIKNLTSESKRKENINIIKNR